MRETERLCVCVWVGGCVDGCVCVCEREKERERWVNLASAYAREGNCVNQSA